ncbi:MAG: hypothetical protein Q8O90_01190 [Elusimicrobiota bacterium]|nr:hypothetical protein [Elusimicrobiota bacterium]
MKNNNEKLMMTAVLFCLNGVPYAADFNSLGAGGIESAAEVNGISVKDELSAQVGAVCLSLVCYRAELKSACLLFRFAIIFPYGREDFNR